MSNGENPFSPPTSLPPKSTIPKETAHFPWPVVPALLWVVILFLGLPLISFLADLDQLGIVLWMKVITSLVTVVAAFTLLIFSKRWWLFVAIMAAIFLMLVQYYVWSGFP